MGFFRGNNSDYLCSNGAENPVSNFNTSYAEKNVRNTCNIFSEISNMGVEELSIYLLTILFMMSGFLLFIYGLLRGQIYQFVMGFIFLISGFILDNTGDPDKAEK